MPKVKWSERVDLGWPADTVSIRMVAPYSSADIIRRIAVACNCRIGPIPLQLEVKTGTRGRVFFVSAGELLSSIADSYPPLRWAFVEGEIRFEFRNAGKPLSPCHELAGRRMVEARPRRGEDGWAADVEYAAIAGELDKAGIRPQNELEKSFSTKLKDWNQKQSRKNSQGAIHTFSKALTHPLHRRGVLKLFYRAEAEWRKHHGNPAS
jgi:hypothetical protein